jgi:hypothetical protein
MRSRAATATISAAVVLLVGVIAWWTPWLTRDRQFAASVPQPPPLFAITLIPLGRHDRACFSDAVMDARSETARFQVDTRGGPAQPLTLSLTGSRYRVVRHIPPDYANDQLIVVPLSPPQQDLAVTACLINEGRRNIELFGSSDRTKAPYTTRVNGRPVSANPEFAFYERRPTSIVDRLSTIMDRARAFRPGFVGPWLLWPLAIAFAIGVPALVLWALHAGWAAESAGEDEFPRDARTRSSLN